MRRTTHSTGAPALPSWEPSISSLRQAIDGNELSLELQPIVDAVSRLPLKGEALVRWNHAEHGTIRPDRFIALAENDRESIDKLLLWCVEEALAISVRLAAAGTALPIAINVSGSNLLDVHLPEHIMTLLARYAVAPAQLAFEITESAAFGDPLRALQILSQLRSHGFDLALDDFGTGFSSLKVLKQLPFTALKIDQSFVVEMTTSTDSRIIVKSIIDLARNMGLRSVAEGVETPEVADLLTALGADALQGYWVAPPMTEDSLLRWLKAVDRQDGGASQDDVAQSI
jgi:EAL domain-containing protein (putative c-di-GMP-specific phosphodiesterase class I)